MKWTKHRDAVAFHIYQQLIAAVATKYDDPTLMEVSLLAEFSVDAAQVFLKYIGEDHTR